MRRSALSAREQLSRWRRILTRGSATRAPPRQPKFNGFKPAVAFSVSNDGKRLLHFDYQSIGCQGSGGLLVPGRNYLTEPSNTFKVGTMKVSGSGKFSVKNAKTVHHLVGETVTTTTTVSGKFTSRTRASGHIRFSQTYKVGAGAPFSCGPAHLSFAVKQA